MCNLSGCKFTLLRNFTLIIHRNKIFCIQENSKTGLLLWFNIIKFYKTDPTSLFIFQNILTLMVIFWYKYYELLLFVVPSIIKHKEQAL